MEWGQKLQAKLSGLSDNASKDSLQALAKWIGFNRKYSESFSDTFVTALTSSKGHQPQYISCISLVCLLDHGNSKKWDRYSDLRTAMAEKVILPTIPQLGEEGRKVLASALKEWDDANSFGGPTLINQIKKKLQEKPREPDSSPSSKEKIEMFVEEPKEEEAPESPQPKKETVSSSDIPVSPLRSSIVRLDSGVVDYDFEASGVEAKLVKPKEFVDPCRTIANLSIIRDLRNDSALQLSSHFSSLPEDIRRLCAKAAEGEKVEIDDATARDFSKRMNPALLDMDIQEQLNNMQDFRKIIIESRKARQALVTLLQQSRCEFGAAEAAEAYLAADGISAELEARKQILTDAMELEGVEPPKLKELDLKDPGTLHWYTPEAKKQKTG